MPATLLMNARLDGTDVSDRRARGRRARSHAIGSTSNSHPGVEVDRSRRPAPHPGRGRAARPPRQGVPGRAHRQPDRRPHGRDRGDGRQPPSHHGGRHRRAGRAGRPADGEQRLRRRTDPRRRHARERPAQRRGARRGARTARRPDLDRDRRALRLAGHRQRWSAISGRCSAKRWRRAPTSSVGARISTTTSVGRPSSSSASRPTSASASISTPTRRSIRRWTVSATCAVRCSPGSPRPVTASHCVSLGQRPFADQRRVAELVAAAGVNDCHTPPHEPVPPGSWPGTDAARVDRGRRPARGRRQRRGRRRQPPGSVQSGRARLPVRDRRTDDHGRSSHAPGGLAGGLVRAGLRARRPVAGRWWSAHRRT